MFVSEQASWAAGMFRGRRAPEESAFDIVGLINDEGEPFKRGGTAFKSNAAVANKIVGMWDGETAGGHRTLFWSGSRVWTLAADDTTPVQLTAAFAADALVSAAEIGGLVFLMGSPVGGHRTEIVWGGSRKTSNYSTGTFTVTAGSRSVTGAGTAWLANVDPGMLLFDIFTSRSFGVVKSVESNTALTLHNPAPLARAGSAYELAPIAQMDAFINAVEPVNPSVALHVVAGSRLLRILDNRIYESLGLNDETFYGGGAGTFFANQPDMDSTYVELPQGQAALGAFGLGEDALIFAASGIWRLSDLSLDPLDDYGNVQQQFRLTHPEVVLWGNAGLAGSRGAVVVPAVDDVYLLEGGLSVISEPIRPLYRRYVKLGYQPGQATVFRGHYILPVLDQSLNVVDVLVCRLDGGFAWSRWEGHAAAPVFARRSGTALLAATNTRVTDCSGCFEPADSNRTDADGNAPAWSVTSRDLDTGPGIRGGMLRHLRVEYDLIAPSALATITASTAVGAEGAALTAHSVTAPEGDGVAKTWMFNRFGERVRWKLECTNAAAELRLRRVEAHMQESQRP